MSSITVSSLVLGSLTVEVDGSDASLALSVLGTAPASLAIELGTPGAQGDAATIAVGTVTTLPAGSAASVTNVGTSGAAVFNFALPTGPKGSTGDTGATGAAGAAATISVGTTTTGAAGSSASVSNSGSSSAAVFNFTIPKGDTGQTGQTGAQGIQGPAGSAATVSVGSVTTLSAGSSASVTNSGTSSAAILNFAIPQGATGSAGTSSTIAIGTTTTGAAGTSASVTNSGTMSAAVLNFTIPKGDTGLTGATGAAGSNGAAATIAVGTTTTGTAGSSASVTNSGTSSAATFNFTIPRGDTGATGATGATGPGVASGGTTGQFLQKASGTNYDTSWATIIPGDRYLTTSTTSLTLANGAQSLTVGTGLSYSPTQDVTIARTSDPTNYHFHGKVTAYDSGTGALDVDVQTHTGSGTFSSWTVNVGGITPLASVSWGGITGTLSDQTDLQTALDGKVEEAPIDGEYYVRKDGAWEQLIIS